MKSEVYLIMFLYVYEIFGQSPFDWSKKYSTCDGMVYKDSYYKTCEIHNITSSSASEFYYSDGQGYSSSDSKRYIKQLKFINCTFNILPNNIFLKLPYILKIECVNCGISELFRNAFANAASLNEINLSHNNITMLENNNFMDAKSLLSIDLAWNKIHTINVNAFNALNNLKSLNLSNNNLNTIEMGTFNTLQKLEVLLLDGNEIGNSVTAELFVKNSNLINISLNKNKIQNFTFGETLKSLNSLSISNNKLESIELPVQLILNQLNVSHNNLETLNISCKIQRIDASYNQIKEFTVVQPSQINHLELQLNEIQDLAFIAELVNLEYLDLTQNQIPVSKFNVSAFKKLNNLKFLFLEDTNLPSFDYSAFGHLRNLETLDISYNFLKHINFNVMSAFQNLQKLFIDGNGLIGITELADFQLILPNLNLIGISNNIFTCEFLRKIYKTLTIAKIEIYIEVDKVNWNKPNFHGVECVENEKAQNITNFLHLNTVPDNIPLHNQIQQLHIAKLDRILNQTNEEATKKQEIIQILQNSSIEQKHMIEYLQNQVEQYSKNLSNQQNVSVDRDMLKTHIVTEDKINNLIDILTKMQLQINDTRQQIDLLLSIKEFSINGRFNTTQIDELKFQMKALEYNLGTKNSSKLEVAYLSTSSTQLMDIKIMVILLVCIALIFSIFQSVRFYFLRKHNRQHGLFVRSSNATMVTSMEENI